MLRTLATAVLLALQLPLVLPAVTARQLLAQAEEKIRAEQFASAEQVLVEAQKLDPADIEVLYRLGYVRFRQRKLVGARADFSKVVKAAPPAWYSRYFLGRISLLENKPREAVTWLEPIAVANQSVFDTSAQLASAYSGAGMRDKAVGALRAAIAATPWDAALYYRLGRLYTEAGQRELAADAYENSKRLRSANRNDVELLMRVSQALASGQQQDAKTAAAPLLGRSDADPNALVALGVIYGGANLNSDALDVFARAAERDPRFFQAQYNRGLALLKMNRAPEALAPLATALELLPQSIDASRTYGLAAVINGRYADAVTPLERAWAAERSNIRTGALLATAYLRTGSAKKAAALLADKSFEDAADPAALLLRAEALNATEDTSGALEAAQQAQKKFPQSPQTHMAVASQLARLGRYAEARPAFAEVLRIAPGYPEAELGLADTLSRAGDHAAAAEHYRAAAKARTTALAARAGLARSLIALRQFDDARVVLEDSVTAFPGEPSLHIELSRVYARLGKPDLAAEQTRIVEKLRGEEPSR